MGKELRREGQYFIFCYKESQSKPERIRANMFTGLGPMHTTSFSPSNCLNPRHPAQETLNSLEQMLYMCNTNPLLHDLGSLLCFEFLAIQDSADNTVGNCIELRDSSSDGRCHVLVFFLIPLRPDASQAMVGHNFLEEFLE